MWSVAGIVAVTIAIIMIEVPSLRRKQLRKEIWIFSILLLFGLGLSIAKSLQVKIPNPVDWITVVYKPLSDALLALLK
ncbi:hypothetical protein AB4Z22_10860 [Paenibacillus sp. TAF58]